MAKPTVYLETSVIGYATSRPSRDLIVAARQTVTRDWFFVAAQQYETYVSRLVVTESSAGDAQAVRDRLGLLQGIPRLEITDEVGQLAQRLVTKGAVPRKAVEDAFHIAVAAVHGMDFLLTWNFKHIANAAMRQAVERACREAGHEPPVICTPEELSTDEPR